MRSLRALRLLRRVTNERQAIKNHASNLQKMSRVGPSNRFETRRLVAISLTCAVAICIVLAVQFLQQRLRNETLRQLLTLDYEAVPRTEETLEKIERLIGQGAALGTRGEDGMTALHFAALCGSPEVVRQLFTRGIPVDCEDTHGQTPLFYAANGVTALQLLELDARVDHKDRDGDVCWTIAEGLDLIRVYADRGVDLDFQGSIGRTLLIWCVQREDAASVEYLLKRGVRVDLTDRKGRDAMSYARSRKPYSERSRRIQELLARAARSGRG